MNESEVNNSKTLNQNDNTTWGEFYPWYTRLFGIGQPDYPIKGKCDPKYASVETEFHSNFLQGREVGASVAIFSNEKCVVELYGGYSDFENGIPYSESTLQLAFSCSKVLEALGVACMVDKGLVKYEDKVCSIWPEFGNNGKNHVTIADLMRHEGGVSYFFDPQPTFAELRIPEKRREVISNHKCIFKEGERSYHAISRGWIVNEIVQHVDPKKRTLGQFYKEEINTPLKIEFYLGLDPSQFSRRSKWYHYPTIDTLISFTFPNTSLAKYALSDFTKATIEKGAPFSYVVTLKDSVEDFENSQDIIKDEMPSANGFTNTKTLATIGSLIANNGEINGYRLISTFGLEQALSKPKAAMDLCLFTETTLTQAGFGMFEFPEFPVKTKFYGWPGMGGSLFLFNPEYRFSFSYMMNGANFITLIGGKAKSLFITAFKAHLESLQC